MTLNSRRFRGPARRALVGAPLLALGALAVAACGARSGLHVPPIVPKPECTVDGDCPGIEDLCNPVACRADGEVDGGVPDDDHPGKCVALTQVDCDDHDPCTNDTCVPTTGRCHYEHATLDLDGDGYFAPLPGHRPGDPGSCGDDCDDTNASAHPGGIEVCDGVDNDCNGIIDDNMTYVPGGSGEVQLSSDAEAPGAPGGLSFNGEHYFATYSATRGGNFVALQQQLNADGSSVPPGEVQFVTDNPAAFAGPLVWTGDRFGMAWSDTRDGASYSVFFAGFQPDGTKLAPGDVLVGGGGRFAVNPLITWNGLEFLVTWQDDPTGQSFDVFARRLALDGTPIGDVGQLTQSAQTFLSAESPVVTTGVSTVGLAYFAGVAGAGSVFFQSMSLDLMTPKVAPQRLSDGTGNAVEPSIFFNRDRYIVSWFEKNPDRLEIYAAAVDEAGKVLVPATLVVPSGGGASRYPSWRPLGDRILGVYAKSPTGLEDDYDLYSRIFLPDLTPVTPETRLTNAPGASISPIAAFGAKGDVGVLFQDNRTGVHDTWFTHLVCNVMTGP